MARSKRERRLVTVFRAFFDESGTDPMINRGLIMGGFYGRVEEWMGVSDAWDDCLRRSPKIDYFKHSEAQGLSDQFVKFNRKQANAKILALATVISKFKLHGFCAVVPYSRIPPKPSQKELIGTTAYNWAFH